MQSSPPIPPLAAPARAPVPPASTIVVGGGPAGLAVAATLQEVGLSCCILERSERIGDSWRKHYDRLRLHTARGSSSLPGLPLSPEYGPWVSRDDFVRYQESYASHYRLTVEHGVTVQRVDPETGGWKVTHSLGVERAPHVVFATGYNHTPFIPPWPGRERFSGVLLHTSEYKNPSPFLGRRVVVVGSGNSGAEIAQDLAEHGVEVSLAIRTPPTVLPRAIAGVPTQVMGILLRPLPPPIVDAVVAGVARVVTGNLGHHGMPPPSPRSYSHFIETGVTPILDVGFVKMLKAGRIRVVGAVEALDEGGARLAGGGRIDVDVVLAATGYRRGLESMVGHLPVLNERGLPVWHGAPGHPEAPGLFFIGFTNPISGNLREVALDARRIARHIARTGEMQVGVGAFPVR